MNDEKLDLKNDITQASENEKSETTKFVEQLHIDDGETPAFPTNEPHLKPGLRKDFRAISILMYLYFMQGLPLGLAGSMPFLLSSRKASFSDQGTFSFVFWPFSIKLLWAPIVDSLFFKRFGRRKSWLIPVQLLIGVLMISLAVPTQNSLDNLKGQSGLYH